MRDAFAALSQDAAFGDDCPAPAELWLAAQGKATPETVQAMTAHLAGCGACAAAWREAMTFGGAASGAAITPPPVRRPAIWLPLAAALVLAIGAVTWNAVREESRDVPASPEVARVDPPPAFVIPLEKAEIQVSARYALAWRGTGDGTAFMQALATALEPYRANDFSAAARALEPVAARYPEASEPQFYLGVSRLLAGSASEAIAPLTRAVETAEGAALYDALFYLAGAFERTGRPADAAATLQRACALGAEDGRGTCALAKRLGAAGAPVRE